MRFCCLLRLILEITKMIALLFFAVFFFNSNAQLISNHTDASSTILNWLNVTELPISIKNTTSLSNESYVNLTAAANERTVQLLMEASIGIDKYGGGIILIIGLLGNTLSFFVLRRRKMKAMASNTYLQVLSISDFLVILIGQGLRHWVRAITGTDLVSKALWYCRTWYLLVPTLSMYSNWVLAGVSVERCIAICFPFLARRILKDWGAAVYLSLSLVMTAVYYCYGFVLYGWVDVQRNGVTITSCNLLSHVDPTFVLDVRPWFEFVISSLIPATLILLCNILIIFTLTRSKQDSLRKDGGGTKEGKQMRSMISMLLTVTFAFVLLTTPMRVAFVLQQLFTPDYWQQGNMRAATNRVLWAISALCLYLNHAINFFLYAISGRAFRLELSLLCGDCSGKKHTTSSFSGASVRKLPKSNVTDSTSADDKNTTSSFSGASVRKLPKSNSTESTPADDKNTTSSFSGESGLRSPKYIVTDSTPDSTPTDDGSIDDGHI